MITKKLYADKDAWFLGASFTERVDKLGLHYLPRRLRKRYIKDVVVLIGPAINAAVLPLQDKIEELTNECFISTATKQSSVENLEKLFVGGCRLDENGEAIYDGK